ncbi:hypothetical protein [Sphingopyxis fribergensis]
MRPEVFPSSRGLGAVDEYFFTEEFSGVCRHLDFLTGGLSRCNHGCDQRIGINRVFDSLLPCEHSRISEFEDGDDAAGCERNAARAVTASHCDWRGQLIFIHQEVLGFDRHPASLVGDLLLAIQR